MSLKGTKTEENLKAAPEKEALKNPPNNLQAPNLYESYRTQDKIRI